MKELLKPYAEHAKVLLGVVSSSLVTAGIYDSATMALILGGVGAAATAFWLVYDNVTKK